MLSMRISFPFIHYFMPSKKWGLVFSETNSFRQCVFGPALPQECDGECFVLTPKTDWILIFRIDIFHV